MVQQNSDDKDVSTSSVEDASDVSMFLDEESPCFKITQMRIQQMKESDPEAYQKMVNLD